MPAQITGLARVTIRAPRRRLDVCLPDRVPLAELLVDLVRHTGDGPAGPTYQAPPDGWLLRRADGTALDIDAGLAPQGVYDGDVLYLVPRQLTWPQPRLDDVAEEMAAAVRQQVPLWTAVVGRRFVVVGAAALAGFVAVALVGLGAGAGSRGLSDLLLVACAALIAMAATLRWPVATGAGDSGPRAVEPPSAVGSMVTSLSTVGAVALPTAVAWLWSPVAGAAFGVLCCAAALVVAPRLALRLAKAPRLVVPDRQTTPEAGAGALAVRATAYLASMTAGASTVMLLSCAVLVRSGATGSLALAGLASTVLVARVRLFQAVGVRAPLVCAGAIGLVLVGGSALWIGDPALRVPGLMVALAVAVGCVLYGAGRRSAAAKADQPAAGGRSAPPRFARLGDVVEWLALVGMAPAAALATYGPGWWAGPLG